MKTRNIREVKKKTKYEDSTDGIVWNLVGRVNVLENKVNVLDKGTMNPERLGGVDDSEEVEFTYKELETLKNSFAYTAEHAHIRTKEDFENVNNLIHKINKMLKEK